MSRHAFLIMSHNQFSLLKILIEMIDYPENDIFVHIDSKVDTFRFEEFENMCRYSNVYFTSKRINVTWGNESQIKAELELFRLAYKHKPYSYYHFISGSDLFLVGQKKFRGFFEDKQLNFLHYNEEVSKWDYQRLSLYRNLFKDGRWLNYSHIIQDFLKVDRLKRLKKKYPIIKRGWNWCDLREDAVKELLDAENDIKRFTWHTVCSDEMYKQIVLLSRGFPIFSNDEGDGIRYIDWTAHGNHPKTLEMSDISRWGGYMLARKFDERIDLEVINYLHKKVINENRNSNNI